MPPHQQDEGAAKIHGQQRHEDGGHDAPDHQSVPFPSPDFMQQAHRMVAEVLDLAAGEREAVGVKKKYADLDEGKK